MPRTARLDAPGVLHHIMIRGIERRKIFRNNKDREDFIERSSGITSCIVNKIVKLSLLVI